MWPCQYDDVYCACYDANLFFNFLDPETEEAYARFLRHSFYY